MATTQTPSLSFRKLLPIDKHPAYKNPSFNPDKVTTIRKGHVRFPGFGAFPIDVVFEQDRAIKLRDGVKIYTDVFHPVDKKVPAVLLWSPYGKGANESGPLNLNSMGPYRIGISYQRLSGYETFEGLNPAEWAQRGYAIVDVDARGVGHSEGNIHFWGPQEAEDVYDTIEWAIKQPWCDGSVVMAGNSWLAISAWNAASRFQHPALKAIAPWEGLTDVYKDQAVRGGRPAPPMFNQMIMGPEGVENIQEMTEEHPLYDDYWESKNCKLENITIPTYILGSYSSGLHSRGSFDAFKSLGTDKKWLRVHAEQEWCDLYREDSNDDLQKFFDYFAKGIDNGWEQTPPLRLSLIGFHESSAKTIIERTESDTTFPLARTKEMKLYLDAEHGKLSCNGSRTESSVSYESHSVSAHARFDFHFDKYTELSGIPWIKLWMSCDSHTDMDVVVQIRKIDASGRLLAHANIPAPVPVQDLPDANVVKYFGPCGILRASHSVSQLPRKSEEEPPNYSHKSAEPVPTGTKVALEIPIWPIGMVFEECEGVAVIVAGHDLTPPDVGSPPPEPADANLGKHTIYAGPETESFLMLPVIS